VILHPSGFFWSKDPCPQGYVKVDASTKNEGCRVVEAVPPGPQPPAEVKAEVKAEGAGKSWLEANWKWLAALAVVGGGAYYYAKRKADA